MGDRQMALFHWQISARAWTISVSSGWPHFGGQHQTATTGSPSMGATCQMPTHSFHVNSRVASIPFQAQRNRLGDSEEIYPLPLDLWKRMIWPMIKACRRGCLLFGAVGSCPSDKAVESKLLFGLDSYDLSAGGVAKKNFHK